MHSIGDEAALCPNCRSRNVGWRNRRPYDVVFTWMRYFADSIPAAILSRKTFDTGGLNRDLYDRVSSAHEMKIGLTTAYRFWRCPDCRQKGQVFSGIDDTLTGGASLGGIRGRPGGRPPRQRQRSREPGWAV